MGAVVKNMAKLCDANQYHRHKTTSSKRWTKRSGGAIVHRVYKKSNVTQHRRRNYYKNIHTHQRRRRHVIGGNRQDNKRAGTKNRQTACQTTIQNNRMEYI